MTTNRRHALAAAVLFVISSAAIAHAEEPRHPVLPGHARSTALEIDRYEVPLSIVRTRSPGQRAATFYADPQLIEASAVLLFEIKSKQGAHEVSRWRCLAVHDVAECLGAPVRIRYLPSDSALVLTAVSKPRRAAPALLSGLGARPALAAR